MMGWQRSCIPYYAQLVEPLQKRKTEGLKGAPTGGHSRLRYTSTARIDATPELLDSFKALQDVFADPKRLVHYDRKRYLYLFIDASKKRGFGVMIAHVLGDSLITNPPRNKVQAILYLSKTLSTAERRYWPKVPCWSG
jgi:hypothetical protein